MRADSVAVKVSRAGEVFAAGVALAGIAGELWRVHAVTFGAADSISARISSTRQAVIRSPNARVGCG